MPTRTKEVETVIEVIFRDELRGQRREVFTLGDSFAKTEDGDLEVYDEEYNVIGLYAAGQWTRAAETALDAIK